MGNNNGKLPDYDPNTYKDDQTLDLNPGNYANFGNYHWDTRPLKEIVKLPLEDQMKLSDAICRKYALNSKFLALQEQSLDLETIDITQCNQTSIGNMAFIAHHNPGSTSARYYERLVQAVNES